MPGLVSYNARFHYDPQWGLLAAAPGAAGIPGVARTSGAPGPVARPGSGRCATAVGPGAALALASPAGQVGSYLPSPAQLTAATLARCPLTVVDLGNLPVGAGTGRGVRPGGGRTGGRPAAGPDHRRAPGPARRWWSRRRVTGRSPICGRSW